MDAQIILALTAALGGLSGLFVAWSSRRKLAAESEGTLVKAAHDVVAIAMSQLQHLTLEVARLTKLLADYKVQLTEAAAQLEIQTEEVARLKKRVKSLETKLRESSIAIPNDQY